MEKDWSSEYLFEQAEFLAKQEQKPLSIDHFWQVADRDLAGAAPKGIDDLFARSISYYFLDKAIATYGTKYENCGPDVEASVKRIKIFNDNKSSCPDKKFALQLFCKINLLFLCREIFNKWLTFRTHAQVCNFFVQKNPLVGLKEQDEVKERLLLFPRRGNKSTINVIDCVQWVINFPDVRILVLTAEDGLATAFIGELKKYFIIRENAPLTTFQTLFEKFGIPAKSDGAAGQFICPQRSTGDEQKKEPTAWAASTGSNLPGWGCDVFKGDDAINDKNSRTSALIEKMILCVDYAESLVDPGGYKDLIGTPYDQKDLYNHTKESVVKAEDIKILRTPAWKLKPESSSKDERHCKQEDYILLFEKNKFGEPYITYDYLRKKQKRNPDLFRSQFLLDPYGTKRATFPMELLYSRTITRDQLPTKLVHYILWDFAYTSNAKSDYSVGAVVGLDEENRIYIVDIFRDRYSMSDLALTVAQSYKQYAPQIVLIENSLGAQNLEPSIRRCAEEIGIPFLPLEFFKPEKFLGAKVSRISSLEPLLVGSNLFFLNEIPCLDDLYREFSGFGSMSHDDIPDAISHLQRIAPRNLTMPVGGQAEKERRKIAWQVMREKDIDDRLYGVGDYAPIIPQAPIEVEPEVDNIDDYFSSGGFPKK